MHFEAKYSTARIPNSTLIYRSDEFSFDVVPPPGGVMSVLLNDLNLDFDAFGHMVSVWGLCPHPTWEPATLVVPNAEFGELLLHADVPTTPGISLRFAQKVYWPVYVDWSSGWIYVKGPESSAAKVKISQEIIVELDELWNLSGLWLHPNCLPRGGT